MPQRDQLSEQLLMFVGVTICIGVSTLVAFVLAGLDMSAPYLSFVPAIALCCLLNGRRAGLVAAILSALSLWYFMIPPPGFALPGRSDLGHLLVFLAVAAALCWIIDFQRRSNDQLAQENFELGYKVSLLRTFRSLRETAQR